MCYLGRLASIFLKLRAYYNLSHVALDFIAVELQHLLVDMENDAMEYKNKLKIMLSSLTSLKSQHLRTNYFKVNFGLNESKAIDMGGNRQQIVSFNRSWECPEQVTKFISNQFHYIPLRQTLTALFNNENFMKLYFKESPSNDGFVYCHRDSKHFAQHPLFSRNINALRLQLFFDDLDTSNALGSKIKNNGELGMFQFSILNLPPQFNSRLSCIFPFAVCKSILLKKNGFDPVLRELMKEIKVLESDAGMLLELKGKPGFRIQGSIASICGDSKGMHEMFGFMSCSATKFCRLCLTSRCDIIKISNYLKTERRTRANYDAGVVDALELEAGDSRTGIVRGCLINESKYLHVSENIILDSMHDFFEGDVPFIITISIREMLLKHPEFGLSAALLNSRIKFFKYSRCDLSNKPSPRFTDEALKKYGNYSTKQRAAQNWCLIRMLPLLIGDHIPEGNLYYSLILNLLNILDIICLPAITETHVPLLQDLIDEIFKKIKYLFPDLIPINKFHHMIHYVEMILLHGPPKTCWSMRFEAAHNRVKRKAHTNNNFKNLSKTISDHLNTIFCADLLDANFCVENTFEIGPNETLSYSDFVAKFSFLNTNCLSNESPVMVARWVNKEGFDYRMGSLVVLRSSNGTEDSLPTFGLIKNCLLQGENTLFLNVQICRTTYFDDHFHGYVVTVNSNEEIIVNVNLLPKFEPTSFLKLPPLKPPLKRPSFEKFICPRHLI